MCEAKVREPRYEIIRKALKEAILDRRIKSGLVLLEGPIAKLFETSRGPVHTALEKLHNEGLIQRFDGRGFIPKSYSSDVTPVREPLTFENLGVARVAAENMESTPAADRIFDAVEEAVTMSIAFGHFKINEIALSEYYGVSRTVAREVLGRLKSRQLVEKTNQSPWLAGPLTARAVADDFEIRALLEPALLIDSAPHLDSDKIFAMQQRLQYLIDHPEEQTATAVAKIESELHSEWLSFAHNKKALKMIAQSQLPLMVNRIFFSTLGIPPGDPVFMEKKLIVDHLMQGAYEAAAVSLKVHLKTAAERTKKRLKVLSVFPQPELPSYMVRVA
ncbi:GntR family transcriptional regulator [Marinobacterium stanieri]|uniref:GntR family transcriptional regulator n=1 Tax=Marinobacterium stanieri TaxID=49186 RepID=UPI0002558F02|nr:GntR family transcriptional regulator [Marinobacterium stanieri]